MWFWLKFHFFSIFWRHYVFLQNLCFKPINLVSIFIQGKIGKYAMPRYFLLGYVGSTYLYCFFTVALSWVERHKQQILLSACEASWFWRCGYKCACVCNSVTFRWEVRFTAISLEDSVANQQPVAFCIALAKLHFCGQTCFKMGAQPTGLERWRHACTEKVIGPFNLSTKKSRHLITQKPWKPGCS